LSGVSPNPANKKDEGIYRFKQKWGGELKKFSEFHS